MVCRPPGFGAEVSMDNQNKQGSRSVWVVVCLFVLFIALIVAAFVSLVSDTAPVIVLGSGLVVVGIWGRRKIQQG